MRHICRHALTRRLARTLGLALFDNRRLIADISCLAVLYVKSGVNIFVNTFKYGLRHFTCIQTPISHARVCRCSAYQTRKAHGRVSETQGLLCEQAR